MMGTFSRPILPAGEFGAALLDPDRATPDGAVGPDGRPDAKRFNVYRNNVVVSLTEALGQTYPAIKALLGDEYFVALARAFVSRYPPESPVLLWYGAEFADFLTAFPPLAAYPYLGDVARLEWAWLQAYHAADAQVLDPADLGAIAPQDLGAVRFVRHPAVAVLASAWPVWDLVRANRFGGGGPEKIDLSSGQSILITRPEFDVEVHLVAPGTAVLLDTLVAGGTLGEAAEQALRSFEDFSLSDCLSECLSSGAFAGLQ